MKDRIMRESIDSLIVYLSHLSRNVSFPEYMLPTGTFLRKFKKNCTNPTLLKLLNSLFDILRQTDDLVLNKRAQLKNIKFVSNFD